MAYIQRKRKVILHPFVHSPGAHNSQGWARLKPGTKHSTHISYVKGKNPNYCLLPLRMRINSRSRTRT